MPVRGHGGLERGDLQYPLTLMAKRGKVWLKPGRDKKIRNAYPWVQKGEIRQVADVEDGGLVTLLSVDNDPLGIATYNSQARFPVRVLTREKEEIDAEFFRRRFTEAWSRREGLRAAGHTGIRALYSEADFVPGLILDIFDGHGVVQVRSLGMEKLREHWIAPMVDVFGLTSLLEKSDMAGRAEEGLDSRVEALHGNPPDSAQIVENGLHFIAPIREGLKTGHYCDQRLARARLREKVRPGDRVLDCFSYTGGFSLHAAAAGAQVLAVDILPLALETATQNAVLNNLTINTLDANAFEYLEALPEDTERFDWIILDPPAISKTKETRDSLKWAVWKLVYHALPHLKPGGSLLVCTCSYQMGVTETLETCRLAAGDRSCVLMLDDITLQDVDHPAPISFPEALYLKGLWLRKV